jgi:serine/threonine protein kinase
MAADLEVSDSVEINYQEVLGVGAYGRVFKAKCGQLPCAAKLLHDSLFRHNDPGTHNLISQFIRECQFLSTIKHPNIIQYLGTTSDCLSQRPVLLMELMDENLTNFLERLAGPLPYHSQLNICYDVALALAYLHSNSIIHRDLSSNNVLLIGEGGRAKVTDFGMSKLMDMNPCMSPLIQVPGTPAYMPPEALTAPPRYFNRLDCFSHGVLTLQIITRKFPTPGDANGYIEDPKYPTGRLLHQFPETERRKKDIDLIEPNHPLLPSVLHCLKDRDTERPSADELCERLALLKIDPRYTRSKEQARECIIPVYRLRQEFEERERANYRQLAETNNSLRNELAESERTLAEMLDLVQLKEQTIQVLQADMQALKLEQIKNRDMVKLSWTGGAKPQEDFSSVYGAAVVRGNTAYLSHQHTVYSYTPFQNKWSILPLCTHRCFGLAVINNLITAVGGLDKGGAVTSSLLSLSAGLFDKIWKDLLPPMLNDRMRPATASTSTHLVVAGGQDQAKLFSTIEVLDVKTLQWSCIRPCALPQQVSSPQLMLCSGHFYLCSSNGNCFSCPEEDLTKTVLVDGDHKTGVWMKIASLPVKHNSCLATLRGRLVALGGAENELGENPSEAIHCYDGSANSWSLIGKMPTPKSRVLAVTLSNNELVLVGGILASGVPHCNTELLHHQNE